MKWKLGKTGKSYQIQSKNESSFDFLYDCKQSWICLLEPAVEYVAKLKRTSSNLDRKWIQTIVTVLLTNED